MAYEVDNEVYPTLYPNFAVWFRFARQVWIEDTETGKVVDVLKDSIGDLGGNDESGGVVEWPRKGDHPERSPR